MKKKLVWCLCLILFFMLPCAAYADMGPKPSVRITFTGGTGAPYYGTLLSQTSSTGPASAWDGITEYRRDGLDAEQAAIWQKFVAYEDVDGFYFLQEWWDCSETNQLSWTYYPPSVFKILLYFPEQDIFYVSPVYERYAFDSYYTVALSAAEGGVLTAEPSYDYTWELASLLARILLTILLELAVALAFGYREKRLLQFLTAVNVVTQVLLNLLLNVINYQQGPMALVFFYVLLELLVFVLEALLYALLLQRYSAKPQTKGKAVGYALIANVVSFAGGLWLAQHIPGIF